MSRAVSVDPDHLREQATELDWLSRRHVSERLDSSGLGTGWARGSFEEFSAYWFSGTSVLADNLSTLAAALRRAAETADRRDADDAKALRGNPRAF
ncbi:hypothetical protein [Leifsonia sp. AG29]|uniref:hypothetical protein n=1 Tax=Leifsonia sp. AG29 TaxID=2598860 RepID=UPI00131B4A0C|nr:hypothetical protein [Leifsonia sp. AG29]